MKVQKFDKRIIKKFALFPTLLDDGNVAFLEFYHIKQYFGQTYRSFNPSEGNMMASPRLSENYWVTYYTYKKL